MSLIKLDSANFNDVINDNEIVFINFGVAGNEHSSEMEELLAACSDKHPEITFATCDLGVVPEAKQAFSITVVPTVIVFREQLMLFSEPSAKRDAWLRSGDRLESAVTRVQQMDMAKLRQMMESGGGQSA